jgi:hypothetical protein
MIGQIAINTANVMWIFDGQNWIPMKQGPNGTYTLTTHTTYTGPPVAEPPDPGPTEEEIQAAIESIKRSLNECPDS